VLRVDLSAATTFRDVLRQVRQVCLDAYTYQVSPELIREDLAQRGEDRQQLFDVWYQLEKPPKEKLDMNGVETSWYTEGKEITRFELSLAIGELDHEILTKLEYDDRIFNAQTTAQMLEDFVQLLNLMTADPETKLTAVSLVSAAAAAAAANLEF
jgi:non-ribosomal peptide synthetase component F